MIHSRRCKSSQSSSFSNTESFYDSLRVDFLVDELFCFTEEFSGKHANRSRSISNFIILYFGNIHQNLTLTKFIGNITLAAALSNAIDFRIVAPSLVTVISPLEADCRILS